MGPEQVLTAPADAATAGRRPCSVPASRRGAFPFLAGPMATCWPLPALFPAFQSVRFVVPQAPRPGSRRLLELANRKTRFTEVSDGRDTEGGRCILEGPRIFWGVSELTRWQGCP